MGRMELVTGPERRRRWSDEDKLRILEEASAPGMSAAAVARRHDLLPQQLYAWRRQFREMANGGACAGGFLPVELIATDEADRRSRDQRVLAERVEIGLTKGRSLRVSSGIDADVLRRLVRAVEEA